MSWILASQVKQKQQILRIDCRHIIYMEPMQQREKSNFDLLSFAEQAQMSNQNSRPDSQRRPQHRILSASSKNRYQHGSRNSHEASNSRLKSSLYHSRFDQFQKRATRKLKIEEQEDNLPTIEFDNVKWIPIIKAYDPSRLKNITVKKQSFEEFFQKHNPKQDPLGQLYIQSFIQHFKQWQTKINRKYSRIIDQFHNQSQEINWDDIDAEIESIGKMTHEMRDTLKTILKKYENHKIRRLIESYQRSLEKSQDIVAVINIVYESKRKIQRLLEKSEGKKNLKKMLQHLTKEKIEETKEVMKRNSNSFQFEIVSKVGQAINSMASLTLDAVNKLDNMKNVIERIQNILTRQDLEGLKGLDQINQIFECVLDQSRAFEQSSSSVLDNNFFNEQFKRKVMHYRKQLSSKKSLVVQYMFSILDSIFQVMINTFRQYESINEPLQRSENFNHLKSGLRNIAKNLVKQQLPQGKMILHFVQSFSKNQETLKKHTQQLQTLKQQANDCYVDDGLPQLLSQLGSLTISHKHNIKEIIKKFSKLKSNLKNRSNQSYIEQQQQIQDVETTFIQQLIKLCKYFNIKKLQNQPLLQHRHLDIFSQQCQKMTQAQASQALKQLQQAVGRYKQLKALIKSNEIKDIIGQIKIKSPIIINIEQLLTILNACLNINNKNYLKQLPKCNEMLNIKQSHTIYQKIVMCKLNHILKPSEVNTSIKKIQKLIEDNKDARAQAANNKHQMKIISQIMGIVPDKTINHELNRLHDEHHYAIQLAQTKFSLDQKDNTYSPNVRFLSDICQRLFTWLFINRQNNSSKLSKQIEKYSKIVQKHSENIGELKNTRGYRQLKGMRSVIDNIEAEVGRIKLAIDKLLKVIRKGDRQQVLNGYAEFIDRCIVYCQKTKQAYFCLVTGKNEPIFLSRVSDGDCNALITRFFTNVGVPYTKQWVGRLKSDWKACTYQPKKEEVKKEEVKRKEEVKKEKEVKKQVKPQVKHNYAQISDEIEDIEDNIQDQIQHNIQDNIQDSIQDNIQDEIPQHQDMQEEIQEVQEIEDVIEPSDDMAQQITSNVDDIDDMEQKPAKPKTTQITEPIKEYKKPSNPITIKMSKIESCQSLLASLNNFQQYIQNYKSTIQPMLFIEALNTIYVKKFIHRDKLNEQSIFNECRQNVKFCRSTIDTMLKANILRDFISLEPHIKKLTAILKQLEHYASLDSLNEPTLIKYAKTLQQLLQLLEMPYETIKSSDTVFIQLGDTLTYFLQKCQQSWPVEFTKQQLKQIKKAYFSPSQHSFTIKNPQELNSNNCQQTLKATQALMKVKQYHTMYNLSDIHKVFISKWKNQPNTSVYDEVHSKNEQKIQQTLKKLDKCVLKYNQAIKDKLNKLKQDIQDYESDLVNVTNAQKILQNPLLDNCKFIKCIQSESGEIFLLATSNPHERVIELYRQLYPDTPYVEMIKQQREQTDAVYYNLHNILSNVLKEIEKMVMNNQYENIYGAANTLITTNSNKFKKIQQKLQEKQHFIDQRLSHRLLQHTQLTKIKKMLTDSNTQNQIQLNLVKQLMKCKNRSDVDKKLQILNDPSFMPPVTANLLYSSDGCLLRVMTQQVNAQASKILTDGTEQVQLRKASMANGSYKYYLPKHIMRYKTKINLQEMKRYVGEVSMKISHGGKTLYDGQLTEEVEIPYVFPGMEQISIEVMCLDKKMEQTLENVKPYDRIMCNIIEKKIKQEIEKKKQEQQLERIRLEEERKERERRQFEQRERLRREEQERLKREQEERLRKIEEERLRKEQQERRKKEQEERRKKEQEERLRKQQEDRKQQERLKKQQEAQQKQHQQRKQQQQVAAQFVKQKSQIALNNLTKEQPKMLRRPSKTLFQKAKDIFVNKDTVKPVLYKSALKSLAQKSRQEAQQNQKFLKQQQQLQKKDIMLKTPEQVMQQRVDEKASEIGGLQQFQQSLTPSEGYTHEDIKNSDLKEVDFMKILRDRGANGKVQQIQKHLEEQRAREQLRLKGLQQ